MLKAELDKCSQCFRKTEWDYLHVFLLCSDGPTVRFYCCFDMLLKQSWQTVLGISVHPRREEPHFYDRAWHWIWLTVSDVWPHQFLAEQSGQFLIILQLLLFLPPPLLRHTLLLLSQQALNVLLTGSPLGFLQSSLLLHKLFKTRNEMMKATLHNIKTPKTNSVLICTKIDHVITRKKKKKTSWNHITKKKKKNAINILNKSSNGHYYWKVWGQWDFVLNQFFIN